MKGFIIDSTHVTTENKTEIHLFGRLENGESFHTINDFSPYLFIREKDEKKASPVLKNFKTEKTKYKNFANEKVIKIYSNTNPDLQKLARELHKNKEINTYEADLSPQNQFLIGKDILTTLKIEGNYEKGERVNRIYKNAKLSPSENKPKIKVAAIDIESDKKADKLFCIGIYTENYKQNFMICDKKVKDTTCCKDEEDCLKKFKEAIIKLDPDIITGWNVIDFDFIYLKKKFDKYKIPFNIGRDKSNIKVRIESGFFRSSTASISGRKVLDGLNLIKDPFIKEAPTIKHANFASFKLEDVAGELLDDKKTLEGKGRHDEIERLFKKGEFNKLSEYNIQDCKLAYDIIDKTKIIDLAIERSLLTGMNLDRITASIASFDSLYIREAHKRNLVSPTNNFKQRSERIKGGYVMSPKPGIYHNVLVLDFKSLYPSIIKTFNIDPAAHVEKKEKGAIVSPNKTYFKNNDGILPDILGKLHEAREKAKKEKRELSSYAIKIIQNSFFGVLASPNCRYYSLKIANAITHFGQMIIKLTAEKIEEKDLKVIYSDTDSVFIETNLGQEKADKKGKEIESYINKFYEEYVKKNYNRKSFLELEFDKQYLSLMLPAIRHSEQGSKKRYAGLAVKGNKEYLDIVGLEAIRGDWTKAAREFQRELLKKVFKKEEFIKYIKDYVAELKKGKMDEKLIYKKSITKPLDQYTKTTPPHVKAARKLDKLESNVIEYYLTENGPEPKQKLESKLDYEHYIKKQIAPIANVILAFFNKTFDEILEESSQSKLF